MPRPQDKERAKLRRAIKRYAEARILAHCKGGGDPADWPQIAGELRAANKQLNDTIREVLPL